MAFDFERDVIDAGVDLENVIRQLDFDRVEIFEAQRVQPLLFYEVIKYRVQKKRALTRAQKKLLVYKSEAALRIRNSAKLKGERPTEGFVNEKLEQDSHYRKLSARVTKAEEVDMFANLMLEDLRHRKEMIKAAVEVVGAEVYVQRRLEGAETQTDRMAEHNARRKVMEDAKDYWKRKKKKGRSED